MPHHMHSYIILHLCLGLRATDKGHKG
eukprot:COSAG01_NODE_41690_length_448_cov_1.160458_1_plen_26_part_10